MNPNNDQFKDSALNSKIETVLSSPTRKRSKEKDNGKDQKKLNKKENDQIENGDSEKSSIMDQCQSQNEDENGPGGEDTNAEDTKAINFNEVDCSSPLLLSNDQMNKIMGKNQRADIKHYMNDGRDY